MKRNHLLLLLSGLLFRVDVSSGQGGNVVSVGGGSPSGGQYGPGVASGPEGASVLPVPSGPYGSGRSDRLGLAGSQGQRVPQGQSGPLDLGSIIGADSSKGQGVPQVPGVQPGYPGQLIWTDLPDGGGVWQLWNGESTIDYIIDPKAKEIEIGKKTMMKPSWTNDGLQYQINPNSVGNGGWNRNGGNGLYNFGDNQGSWPNNFGQGPAGGGLNWGTGPGFGGKNGAYNAGSDYSKNQGRYNVPGDSGSSNFDNDDEAAAAAAAAEAMGQNQRGFGENQGMNGGKESNGEYIGNDDGDSIAYDGNAPGKGYRYNNGNYYPVGYDNAGGWYGSRTSASAIAVAESRNGRASSGAAAIAAVGNGGRYSRPYRNRPRNRRYNNGGRDKLGGDQGSWPMKPDNGTGGLLPGMGGANKTNNTGRDMPWKGKGLWPNNPVNGSGGPDMGGGNKPNNAGQNNPWKDQGSWANNPGKGSGEPIPNMGGANKPSNTGQYTPWKGQRLWPNNPGDGSDMPDMSGDNKPNKPGQDKGSWPFQPGNGLIPDFGGINKTNSTGKLKMLPIDTKKLTDLLGNETKMEEMIKSVVGKTMNNLDKAGFFEKLKKFLGMLPEMQSMMEDCLEKIKDFSKKLPSMLQKMACEIANKGLKNMDSVTKTDGLADKGKKNMDPVTKIDGLADKGMKNKEPITKNDR